jgi:hypothetical protein
MPTDSRVSFLGTDGTSNNGSLDSTFRGSSPDVNAGGWRRVEDVPNSLKPALSNVQVSPQSPFGSALALNRIEASPPTRDPVLIPQATPTANPDFLQTQFGNATRNLEEVRPLEPEEKSDPEIINTTRREQLQKLSAKILDLENRKLDLERRINSQQGTAEDLQLMLRVEEDRLQAEILSILIQPDQKPEDLIKLQELQEKNETHPAPNLEGVRKYCTDQIIAIAQDTSISNEQKTVLLTRWTTLLTQTQNLKPDITLTA